MSVKKLLEELDIETMDDEFALEDNMDVIDELETMLIIEDEDGNLIPEHIFADSILLTYELTEEELINLIKESGVAFKLFRVEPNEIFEGGLVVGNEACTTDQIKEELESIYNFEDGYVFEVSEIKEEPIEVEEEIKEEKEAIDVLKDKIDVHGEEDTIVIAEKGQLDNPDAPKIEVEVSKEEKEILEPEFHEEEKDKEKVKESAWNMSQKTKDRIRNWWEDLIVWSNEHNGVFNIDNSDGYEDMEAWHAAMFDMLGDIKAQLEKEEDEELKRLYKKGKLLYNNHALSQYSENLKEIYGMDGDYIYYCVSDGMNPRNSRIIPNGEGARERAIEIAKANPKYKYVSIFKNGEETVIWHADDFDTKGMRVEEAVKEGPDDIFGYINGDLASFDPKAFIEKVQERKTSLHTNRIIKNTDDVKICHHIVCECLGWGDDPKIFIDVVEETWTRNPGDADDINSYYGTTEQDRILMESCGRAPKGFDKAIEVLEKYKADTLAKNESLEEKCLDEKPTLGKAREEKAIRWNFTFGFEKLLNLIEEYKRTKDESILKVISDASNMFVTDLNKDIASNKYSKEEKEVVNKLKEKYLEIAHALSDVVKGLESNEVVSNIVKNADTITTNANNIKVNESIEESKGLSRDQFEKDNIGYKFLELYCEPNETIQYDGDNFSIIIRLPIEEENPTEEEAEEFLGDDHLLVNGKQYHVVGVWESDGGAVFDPYDIAMGGAEILDYRKPPIIQASNEGELKEALEYKVNDDGDTIVTDGTNFLILGDEEIMKKSDEEKKELMMKVLNDFKNDATMKNEYDYWMSVLNKHESLKEDKDQDKLGLPRELTITLDDLGLDFYEDDEELEEAISDWLSDEYGYCHNGFNWEHGDDVDTIEIYDIDWDTSEN